MSEITGRVTDMTLEDVIEDNSNDIDRENDFNREIADKPRLILRDGIEEIDVFKANDLVSVEGLRRETDVVFKFLGSSKPNVGIVETQRTEMDFDHVARAAYYAVEHGAKTIVLIADKFGEPVKRTIRNAISDEFHVWGFVPRFVESSDGLKINLVERITPADWEQFRQKNIPEDGLSRHQGVIFTTLSDHINIDIQSGTTLDRKSGVDDKRIREKYDTRVYYSVKSNNQKLTADRGQSISNTKNDFINVRIVDPSETVVETAIEDYNASYSEEDNVLIWIKDVHRSEHNEIVDWFKRQRSDAEEILKQSD